jgi:putative transposase
MSRRYPSDVTDAEWALLEPFFFPPGAPRKAGRVETPENVRACLDAIRYLLKTGCQWRMLPKDFPPRSTVHEAFTRWSARGLWEQINTALREKARVAGKKTPSPAPRSSTARA